MKGASFYVPVHAHVYLTQIRRRGLSVWCLTLLFVCDMCAVFNLSRFQHEAI